jgi:hypothetical protein
MAYFSSTTPDYPVITWEHNIAADITVTVEYNSVSYNGTIAAGDYWGFAMNSSSEADADSLMGILASTVEDVLTDPAKHNLSVTLSAEYDWSTTTPYVLIGRINVDSGTIPASNVEITLSSNKADFGSNGLSADDITISNISLNGSTDFSVAGFWAPYNKSVLDDRDYVDTTYSVESISGDSTSVVKWGTQKTKRVLTFPVVYAAYIFAYRAGDSGFADPADRNVLDPNNLLQNLKSAVAGTGSDFTLRIYQDEGEYRSGRVVDSDKLQSLESYIKDISARGAMYEVTIPMTDLGDAGVVGGAT